MTMNTQWENVEVLIPQQFRAAQNEAMSGLRFDLTSLLEALPSTNPNNPLATSLADADLEQGRTWLASVVRALPTQADMEAEHGSI